MLESLILDENNPKLHRAGSGHVISWVLQLKIIFQLDYKCLTRKVQMNRESKHSSLNPHLTPTDSLLLSHSFFGALFFLVRISTTKILPTCNRLSYSTLFDFLPESESAGCVPVLTLLFQSKSEAQRRLVSNSTCLKE